MTLVRYLLLVAALFTTSLVCAQETYTTSDEPLLTTFDGGAGLLYLAPHSEVRRVGQSLVLLSGRAVWGHPEARGAKLTIEAQTLELSGGGLVGLVREDDAQHFDLYLGQGEGFFAGRQLPLGAGERHSIRGQSLEQGELPPINLSYGPALYEPLSPAPEHAPTGLGGVLMVTQPGLRAPLTLDPRDVRVHVTPRALDAEVEYTLTFSVEPMSGDAMRLAVFQGLLPERALITGLSASHVDAYGDAQEWSSQALHMGQEEVRDTTPMRSLIRAADPNQDSIQRYPAGFRLHPGPDAHTLTVTYTFWMPLARDETGSYLSLPALGNNTGRRVNTLEVRISTPGELQSNLPLKRDEQGYVWSASDAPLEPGLVAFIPDSGERAWTGSVRQTRGSFFAIDTGSAPAPQSAPQGRDVLILLDSSASMTHARHRHAVDALKGFLEALDPSRDRIQLVRISDTAEALFPGFQRLDDASARAALETRLEAPPLARGTDLLEGLEQGRAALETRVDTTRRPQVVLVSDREPSSSDTPGLLALGDVDMLALSLAPRLGRGGVPTVRANPHASGLVSAARMAALMGQALPPTTRIELHTEAIREAMLLTTPTGWHGHRRLFLGRFETPKPFFDVPGTARYCLAPPGDVRCSAGDIREMNLGQARDVGGPGRLLRAARARLHAECRDEGEEQCLSAAERSAELEPLGLMGPLRYLQLVEAQAPFESGYHTLRGQKAAELAWMPSRSELERPRAGRIVASTTYLQLPAPSDAQGMGSLPLPPLVIDDHLQLQHPDSARGAPPTLESILSGDMGSSSGYREIEPAYSRLHGEKREVAYAIQEIMSNTTGRALSTARSRLFDELGGQIGAQEDFLDAWMESALGSSEQLYNISSHYHQLNLYEKGTLAQYHAQAADLKRWEDNGQRQNIIVYYIDQKLYAHAERLIVRGQELYPQDPFYHDRLVQILRAQKQEDRLLAIEIDNLRKQLMRRPDDSALVDALIVRLVQTGKAGEARKTLDDWKERLGTSPTFYRLTARLAQAQGRDKQALELLETGVQGFPDSRIAHAALIQHLSATDQLERARKAAQRWLERDPDNLYLTQYLGDLHTRLDQHQQAFALYARIAERAPDAALGFIKMGDALSALGERADTTAAYRAALLREPSSVGLILRVAEAAAHSGEFELAESAFEKLRPEVALDPYGYPSYNAVEDELLYQFYLQWRADALYHGEDDIADAVLEKMKTRLSSVPMMMGHSPYALRAVFLPESRSHDVRIDFRITEPNGSTLSYISPYNNMTGSQLYSTGSSSGSDPRIYHLPVAESGDFTFEITFEGPAHEAPLRGHLFVHKIPQPFTEHWEEHEVLLERPGDSFRLSLAIKNPPSGSRTVPPQAP